MACSNPKRFTQMEVLLRKASTLARACSQAAAKIDTTAVLKLSVHSHGSETNYGPFLSSASADLYQRIQDVLDLHQTQASIRRLIGAANVETVSPLLAERDYLNASEMTISTVLAAINKKESRRVYDTATVRVEHNSTQVREAFKSLSNRATTVTSGDLPDVEVPALDSLSVAALESRLATIQRRRSDLMDELAAANLTKRVKLPEAVMKVLLKHRIID
jgi:hypothetical protein